MAAYTPHSTRSYSQTTATKPSMSLILCLKKGHEWPFTGGVNAALPDLAFMEDEFTPEYTRRLPHFLRAGYTFFVTFRLHGSLPMEFLEKLRTRFESQKSQIETQQSPDAKQQLDALHREYFYAYDQALDACEQGPTHLKDPKIALLVADQLSHFDKKYYHLIGYTLMPNHVHTLLDFSAQVKEDGTFDRKSYKNLDYVMDRVKGASARFANLELGTTGQAFWQAGFHDRYIRDQRHLTGALRYLKQNPVSAKLCDHWMEHPFTYVHQDYLVK